MLWQAQGAAGAQLRELTLRVMNELQEMPDTLGRMTAIEHLTLDNCSKLRTLPASIMHLSRLQLHPGPERRGARRHAPGRPHANGLVPRVADTQGRASVGAEDGCRG